MPLSIMPPYLFVGWRRVFCPRVAGHFQDLGNPPKDSCLSARLLLAVPPCPSICKMPITGSGCWLASSVGNAKTPGCLLMSVLATWMALPLILLLCLHKTRPGSLHDKLAASLSWSAAADCALTSATPFKVVFWDY